MHTALALASLFVAAALALAARTAACGSSDLAFAAHSSAALGAAACAIVTLAAAGLAAATQLPHRTAAAPTAAASATAGSWHCPVQPVNGENVGSENR